MAALRFLGRQDAGWRSMSSIRLLSQDACIQEDDSSGHQRPLCWSSWLQRWNRVVYICQRSQQAEECATSHVYLSMSLWTILGLDISYAIWLIPRSNSIPNPIHLPALRAAVAALLVGARASASCVARRQCWAFFAAAQRQVMETWSEAWGNYGRNSEKPWNSWNSLCFFLCSLDDLDGIWLYDLIKSCQVFVWPWFQRLHVFQLRFLLLSGPLANAIFLGEAKVFDGMMFWMLSWGKHVYLKNPALECFWMIEEDLRGLIWTNCSNAMFGKSLERFNRRNCSWEIAVDMGLLPNLRLFFAGNSSQLLMQVSHMQVKPNPFQAISRPPFIQLPATAWERWTPINQRHV